jgi:hypothetical protein
VAARWHRWRQPFLSFNEQEDRRLDMSTPTIDDRLAEAQGRIDGLRTRAQAGAAAERSRIRRHLDVLEHDHAAVRAAARSGDDEVERKLAELRARLDVAEHSLTVDASDDWASFAAAVEAELHSWDAYLERLQASVAAKALAVRAQAEAAIGDVRTRRIEVDERLTQARGAAGDATGDAREHVTAARDKLEQKADELSAKLT